MPIEKISHVVFIGSHVGRKIKRQTQPPYKKEPL